MDFFFQKNDCIAQQGALPRYLFGIIPIFRKGLPSFYQTEIVSRILHKVGNPRVNTYRSTALLLFICIRSVK